MIVDQNIIDQRIIDQTKKWIKTVVIYNNLCPFAASPMLRDSIRYHVSADSSLEKVLNTFADELHLLHTTPEIETTFLILPHGFAEFENYLSLVSAAEAMCDSRVYRGHYQVASFHPDYCFTDADETDPANYTNRSVYAMLHVLREASITKALEKYENAYDIPRRNAELMRQKGLQHVQLLRASCQTEEF